MTPREQVSFSMAIINVEFMHQCFPKHSGMGTARMNKTKKEMWQREKSEHRKKQSGHERSEVGTKERC